MENLRNIIQKDLSIDKKTNAEWRVQFFWPFKFKYLVIDLAEDYQLHCNWCAK